MASQDKKSLAGLSASRIASNSNQAKPSNYQGLEHPPNFSSLKKEPPKVQALSIPVRDSRNGAVSAFLHLPSSGDSSGSTAAILVSGAGGGVVGPSSIYLSLAAKLPVLQAAIPVLRLDYRYPARNGPCVRDVLAAMDHLETAYSLRRFVLVGWSFGGAPVFTVGGSDPRVVGCATVASQTAETEGIARLAPRPLLLLHGTGDRTLSPRCSEQLWRAYGARGERDLKLFEGDDHALSGSAEEAERLIGEFIVRCAGGTIGDGEGETVLERDLMSGRERLEGMKKGGDLRGDERVE